MGRQIIKQPNGKYAVWSSIVDDFVMFDATAQEIIDDWVSEESERIADRVHQVIAALDNGMTPYHQFTRTWDDALNTVQQVHGASSETWGILREIGLAPGDQQSDQ